MRSCVADPDPDERLYERIRALEEQQQHCTHLVEQTRMMLDALIAEIRTIHRETDSFVSRPALSTAHNHNSSIQKTPRPVEPTDTVTWRPGDMQTCA